MNACCFCHSPWLFMTPWTTAHQASLSFTISWSLLKLMSIESGMPSNHLVPCLLFSSCPQVFPRISIFSNELVLCISWPKYWSFSFSISPSNKYSGLISFRIDWFDLFWSPCSPRDSQVFSNTTAQTHQFFGAQLSSPSNSQPYMTTGKTIALTRQTLVSNVSAFEYTI